MLARYETLGQFFVYLRVKFSMPTLTIFCHRTWIGIVSKSHQKSSVQFSYKCWNSVLSCGHGWAGFKPVTSPPLHVKVWLLTCNFNIIWQVLLKCQYGTLAVTSVSVSAVHRIVNSQHLILLTGLHFFFALHIKMSRNNQICLLENLFVAKRSFDRFPVYDILWIPSIPKKEYWT